MKPLLHPKTAAQLESMSQRLPHAVLINGQKGIGITTIARYLAGNDLADHIEPTNAKEEIDHVAGSISVDRIRRLYEQTRAKNTASRVYILDNADRLTLSAQAAFLKLLEEPNEHTHFILTTHNAQLLSSTIRSRVQTVTAEPITKEQTDTFLRNLGVTDERVKTQLNYLASGLPAELLRLTQDGAYFKERAEIMTDTRTFLTGATYDQLLIAQKYQQSKTRAIVLIDSALAVTQRSLAVKPQPNLVAKLETLLQIRENLLANCNTKLQLTSFVL